MVQEKIKLVIITGPTAVGKSAAAVSAALSFGGEIVGADSMQIYRGMDIGTGKITESEKRGVIHHMIDVAEPDEDYSVGRYCSEAKTVISDIARRGKLPMLVGGTGLYINSLLFGHSFAGAPKDEAIRAKLRSFAETEGTMALYERLKAVDSKSATVINANDLKRVIRALEIYELTGKPRSEFGGELTAAYDYLLVVMTDEREALYGRIDRRVGAMMAAGLLDEVRSLYKYKDCNSMQAIGYKELVEFLDGKCTLSEATDAIKQNSRRYAKRQMTYFRGMKADKIFVDNGNIYELIKDFTN